MKLKQNGIICLCIVVFIGILLTLGGISFAIFYGIDSRNYVEIQAIIRNISISYDSDGEEEYYVTVDFEYDGTKYNDVPISFWDSEMYEGKVITIMCNKNNPTKLANKTFWIILPCILFGVGILLIISASIALHKTLFKNKQF